MSEGPVQGGQRWWHPRLSARAAGGFAVFWALYTAYTAWRLTAGDSAGRLTWANLALSAAATLILAATWRWRRRTRDSGRGDGRS